MERSLLVLLAILLNAALFGSRRFYDALALDAKLQWPSVFIRGIDRKLNRPERTLNERRQRGWLLLAAMVMAALGVSSVLGVLFSHGTRFGELLLLALLLPVRPCFDRTLTMYKSLTAHDTLAAREGLKGTVWRHYALLDEHAVARAAIEIMAVQFSEKIVAPVLWYLLLGLPGLLVNKGVYVLKESLCQPLANEVAFSKPTQWVHFAMNYIPSRFALLLWFFAVVFVPAHGLVAALKALFKSKLLHATPEEVSVLAASCCLKLSLGGPTSVYTGGEWEGSGTAKATTADIKRAQMLYMIANGLLFAMIGLLV